MSDPTLLADEHDHAHGNQHGGPLSAHDRHQHEAETYDAMARQILSDWGDGQFVVSPDSIPFPNREHIDYLSFAIAELGPLAGRRILEVGAGSGSLAVWLAQQGAEVVAIDVSSGILDVARKRAEINGVGGTTHFIHSPVEDFNPRAEGLDHDTYDAIIGNNVVHHFDRDAALANLGRLLAPGAVAVFCEPVLFVPEWVRSARNSSLVTRRFPMHTHSPDERSLDRADFALMSKWFRHVALEPFQVLSRLQNFVELTDPMWNRLESIDRRLLRRVPAARTACRIVVVTLGLPREVNS